MRQLIGESKYPPVGRESPRCRQDPNSNDDNTRADSVESMDSGTCILTGKGFGYPPVILVCMAVLYVVLVLELPRSIESHI